MNKWQSCLQNSPDTPGLLIIVSLAGQGHLRSIYVLLRFQYQDFLNLIEELL